MDLDKTLSNAVPFNRSLYPRTYPVAMGWRIFMYAFSVVAIAGGVAGAIYFPLTTGSRAPGAMALLAGICALFAAFGAYAILDTRKSRIVLFADAIERHELRGMRSLLRSQIAGRRTLKGQYGSGYIVLEPKPGQDLKALKVPTIVARDQAFHAWIGSLPDLDILEVRQGEAAIAADQNLGPNPAERMRRLKLARRGGAILNGSAYVVLIWGLAFPRPYSLVIAVLILLPWAAVALTAWNSRLFSLDTRKAQASVGLALLCILPGSVLAMRALLDVHIVNWQSGLALAFAGAVIFGVIAVVVDPDLRRRRAAAISFAFVMAAYGYGAGLELNTLMDYSAPRFFQVMIESKHVAHGKTTNWYLALAPWGPRTQSADVAVPRSLYETLQVGDVVCVGLYDGALRMQWYAVHRCPSLIKK